MLDYDKQRKLIIVFILATTLVIIFAIIALVLIWLPEEEEIKEFKVGEVTINPTTQEDVILKYYDKITQLFLEEDVETIYSMISEDYLSHNNLKKEDIREYLTNKRILGRKLQLVSTNSYKVAGYNNVYYLDIKAVNEVYSIGIVIKESSPENYTISFDKFIDVAKNVCNTTVNSVSINIYERVRYINSVEFKFTITNNYDKALIVNNNSLGQAILLVGSQSQVKLPIMTTLATSQIRLEPQQSRPFSAVYNINDQYDYLAYNTLVLKDVVYEGIQGETDLEITLNY